MINLGKHFEKTEVTKEQLQAINEVLGIKDSKVWKPKEGEWYYTVTGIGGVKDTLWINEFQDDDAYDLGNVFETQEQALFARDKQVFLTKMKRDFIENSDEIDWNNSGQNKYILFYANANNKLDWASVATINYGRLCTTDLEWLKQYARENEDNIKKYYFEVKEKENEKY